MTISFSTIIIGESYSRPVLASLWGYRGYQALARGVFTPRDDNKIVLFVTERKPEYIEQYKDDLTGDVLNWEGPTDHFAEERMLNASTSDDEIHLFYRERHHSDFIYEGEFIVTSSHTYSDRPSVFLLVRK